MIAAGLALVIFAVGTGVMWSVAGLRRDPQASAAYQPEAASRNVSVLGGLAGFAVTGVVLLVGQTSNLIASGADFTNVLAMFVVAYMGLLSVSIQLANVSEKVREPFDLAAAQHTVASISLYFSFVGWFALRPLFQAFGLPKAADITGWLLVIANLAGYPFLAVSLVRGGFARIREIVLLAAIGAGAAIAYIVLVRTFVPGGRAPDGTLILALVAFVPGAVMYGMGTGLPLLADQPRFATMLRRSWHLVVLAYAVSVVVIVELLLVSVLGFA